MSGRLPLGWRVRAAAAALIVPPLLYFISFARLATWLSGSSSGKVERDLDDRALARWVDRLLRNVPGPWRRTCLKRSAVLYYLLRRAGRPVELCIGVRNDEQSAVAAHAWLVLGGATYLEARPEHAGRHTVIARFPGTRATAARS